MYSLHCSGSTFLAGGAVSGSRPFFQPAGESLK
jgi:hypothetical protein